VVCPERIEYPCLSAEEREGAATKNAAIRKRATMMSPAALRLPRPGA
jgi:hypothetical protein